LVKFYILVVVGNTAKTSLQSFDRHHDPIVNYLTKFDNYASNDVSVWCAYVTNGKDRKKEERNHTRQ